MPSFTFLNVSRVLQKYGVRDSTNAERRPDHVGMKIMAEQGMSQR